MAEPRVATAVERVFDDAVLLSRILWTPGVGGGPVIGIYGLATAACVRRSWCDAVRDEAVWLPLLRAVEPRAAPLKDGASAYRAFVQLRRLGVASLPSNWFLHNYSILIDVSHADGTVLACASLPLSALRFGEPHSARLGARTATDALADGGAATAAFLAQVTRCDTGKLRLRMLLRSAEGATALLTHRQPPICPDENDDLGPYANEDIWPDEDERYRAGAVTWHSSSGSDDHIFGKELEVPARFDELSESWQRNAHWTWALHFPASEGAVTQLSRLELRIGQRVEKWHEDWGREHSSLANALFGGRELAGLFERQGVWVEL